MTDKSAAAARELVERWMGKKHPITMRSYVSDLTALISEHYVSREECKELLQQRDELKEALLVAIKVLLPYQDLYNAVAERNAIKLAEAAIKNTETK